MTEYYIGKYLKDSDKFYKMSRSKVELFMNCKRCFYLDRKLGISPPPGFPFNLNSAVDNLLKNEFDFYRDHKEPHPYITKLGLNAIPFNHKDMDRWRRNFTGVSYDYKKYQIHLFGAVDDLWVDLDSEELIVVDYKATSKLEDVSIDADWQISYKRQMEFYQYLLRKNNFKVSDTGYFVYCNGIKDEMFKERLNFKVSLLPYKGNDSWIEDTLYEIYNLLQSEIIPPINNNCSLCDYQVKTKPLS